MNLNIKTLDNGLKVYFLHDPNKNSVYFELVTLFGGRNNDFIIDNKEYHIPDGIAHLLEHYTVEGSKYGKYITDFAAKGIISNAVTNNYRTYYYFDAVTDIDYAVNTLLRNCYNLVFKEETLAKVKKPIIQELKMYQDNKGRFLMKNIYASLFSKINFRSVEGEIEDIEKFDLETLKLIYETFYVPHNQVIIVVGNFNEKHLFKTIKEFYSNLKITKHEFKLIDVLEPNEVSEPSKVIHFPTAIDNVDITWKINIKDLVREELVKFDLYVYIYLLMSFNKSSQVYKKLIKDNIIIDELELGCHKFLNFYLVEVMGKVQNQKQFIKEVENVLSRYQYDESKFNLLKRELIINIIKQKQKKRLTANQFINYLINYDYENILTIEFIEKLNFKEFKETINKIDFTNYAVTILENKV